MVGGNLSVVRDFRFSQQFCLRFKSTGIFRFVTGNEPQDTVVPWSGTLRSFSTLWTRRCEINCTHWYSK